MQTDYKEYSLNIEKLSDKEKSLMNNLKVFVSDENILIHYDSRIGGELLSTWELVKHIVAGQIQCELKTLGINDNLAWNMYIYYLIDFDISSEDQNLIESDKFCCKKYVIDTRKYKTDEEAIVDQVPLFSSLDFKQEKSSIISNESQVKEVIISHMKTHKYGTIFKNTLNIDEITEEDKLNDYLQILLKSSEDLQNG